MIHQLIINNELHVLNMQFMAHQSPAFLSKVNAEKGKISTIDI